MFQIRGPEDAPQDHEALRQAIYGGEVFLLDPTEASLRLVDRARAALREHLGGIEDVRQAHARYDDAELFERIGRARRQIYMEPRFHAMCDEVMASLGFAPEELAIDPARIRTVMHDGHKNPRAQAVYATHRDTWYGHPPCLITWWVPLHDLGAEETFLFYPERFDRPVPNDSEVFDYEGWTSRGWSLKIGWQDREAGLRATYPQLQGDDDELGPEVGFSCRAGQNLLFAGSHLHGTRPQSLGTTRFSLDWRVAHLEDARQGRGAPQVDNRSRGSALGDYVHPPARGLTS